MINGTLKRIRSRRPKRLLLGFQAGWRDAGQPSYGISWAVGLLEGSVQIEIIGASAPCDRRRVARAVGVRHYSAWASDGEFRIRWKIGSFVLAPASAWKSTRRLRRRNISRLTQRGSRQRRVRSLASIVCSYRFIRRLSSRAARKLQSLAGGRDGEAAPTWRNSGVAARRWRQQCVQCGCRCLPSSARTNAVCWRQACWRSQFSLLSARDRPPRNQAVGLGHSMRSLDGPAARRSPASPSLLTGLRHLCAPSHIVDLMSQACWSSLSGQGLET